MSEDEPVDQSEQFEKALEEEKTARYVLRLFIAGMTRKSREAIDNIRQVCETRLHGRYTLEVIDIYQQPDLARDHQILAVPTLVKSLPPPLRRIIGDLSGTERILVGLNLQPVEPPSDDSQGEGHAEI